MGDLLLAGHPAIDAETRFGKKRNGKCKEILQLATRLLNNHNGDTRRKLSLDRLGNQAVTGGALAPTGSQAGACGRDKTLKIRSAASPRVTGGKAATPGSSARRAEVRFTSFSCEVRDGRCER